MRLREIAALISLSRPPAPHGMRHLARCNSIDDLARLARRRLPAAVAGYLDGGAEDEHTLRCNSAAFDDVELVPHVLRDVHDIDTSTTILGSPVPVPIALAPIGAQRLMHHEGELAVAGAASRAGVPYTVSTLATAPMAQIAEQQPSAPCGSSSTSGGTAAPPKTSSPTPTNSATERWYSASTSPCDPNVSGSFGPALRSRHHT